MVARDPVDAIGYYNLGITYLDAGIADKAIGAFETALRLSPGTIGAHYGIGVAHLLKDDPAAALDSFSREGGDEEYRVKGTALAHHGLGQMEEFERYFGELKDQWGEEWPSEIAHVYTWTGDADSTFAWLDRALAEEGGLNEQFLQSFFIPVHEDPRWAAFREQTGTSQEQLDAIEFSVALPE